MHPLGPCLLLRYVEVRLPLLSMRSKGMAAKEEARLGHALARATTMGRSAHPRSALHSLGPVAPERSPLQQPPPSLRTNWVQLYGPRVALGAGAWNT
eukprot:7611326-Pyramimonas_sp.AAC.1